MASGACIGTGSTWSLSSGFFIVMTNKYSVETILYFIHDNAIYYSRPTSITINREAVFYNFGVESKTSRQERDVFESKDALIEKLAFTIAEDYNIVDYPF